MQRAAPVILTGAADKTPRARVRRAGNASAGFGRRAYYFCAMSTDMKIRVRVMAAHAAPSSRHPLVARHRGSSTISCRAKSLHFDYLLLFAAYRLALAVVNVPQSAAPVPAISTSHSIDFTHILRALMQKRRVIATKMHAFIVARLKGYNDILRYTFD